MALTYTYSNGNISHYALKKVNGNCNKDSEHTILIGVFCQLCPFYEGIFEHKYVICSFHKKDDIGDDVSEIRSRINEQLKDNALRAFYD